MGQKKMLKSDVLKLLQLLKEREWAEHFSESDLGKELESAVTSLLNEISELHEKLEEQQKPEPVVDLPNSETVRLYGNVMYSDSVITALQKAGVKYKW